MGFPMTSGAVGSHPSSKGALPLPSLSLKLSLSLQSRGGVHSGKGAASCSCLQRRGVTP